MHRHIFQIKYTPIDMLHAVMFISSVGRCSYSFLFLPDPRTWSALQKRFQRKHTDGIADIYDGEGYKGFSEFLMHPAHVSLLVNTDGVALYRSSSVSVWPVWAVVNELPPTLRYVT